MTLETKNKIGLVGFIVFFVAAGVYVRATWWPAKKEPPARQASTQPLRGPDGNVITAEERAQMRAEVDRTAMEFCRASPEKKEEILAREFAKWEERRTQWQARRAEREAAATQAAVTQPATTEPATQPTTRPGQDRRATWNERRMQRMLAGDPQRRAAWAEYRAALRKYREDKGVPAPTRPR